MPIEDPEQEPDRWDEPIIASSPQEALAECKKIAESYDMELESIEQPSRLKSRPQIYRCRFKGRT